MQNARRSQQVRARAGGRPTDLTERLNVFAKAAALGVLVALIGIVAFGQFYDARFNGLVSTTAMEIADIAQQARAGHGMSTKVIRPLALAHGQPNEEGVMPEMLHPPLYPYLLSWLFRARGGGDASVALFNGLMFLLTGWVVYAIARLLWDKVVALLAVAVYFVSVDALGQALTASGASLAGLLFTIAVWAALRNRQSTATSQDPNQNTVGPGFVIWPVIAGGIFGLTYLGGLTSLLLIIPLAVLATAGSRSRWLQVGLMVIAAVVVISPWVARNLRVTGTLLPPMANYVLLTHTQTYPGESVFQHLPDQVLPPMTFVFQRPGEILNKVGRGLTMLYRGGPNMLNPYLFPFFIFGAFLFERNSLKRSLWRVVLAMFALQGLSICVYRLDLNGLGVLLPIAMCLTVAGLVETLRRTEASRLIQVLVGVLICGLVLFPTVSSAVLGKKMPRNRTMSSLQLIDKGLTDDAVVVTDDPAAVAWYAHKQGVLLPDSPASLARLPQWGIEVHYLYLSKARGETVPRAALNLKPWYELLQSEDAPKQLGKFVPLPEGEMLFERVNKRIGSEVGE